MKEQVCSARCPYSKYQQVEYLQTFLSVYSETFVRLAKEEQQFFVTCSCKTRIMIGDFFEELICATNLIVVRSVSNMFSVGEVSFKYLYDASPSKILDFDRCFSTVNQQLENRKQSACTYYVVLPRNTPMIGHKGGEEETTAIPLPVYPHQLSFQRTFSVALLLKCH